MTEKEWIDRCAKRYMERGWLGGWLGEYLAIRAAHACFENDAKMIPEEAADVDMECWYEWEDEE